ncbi:MAG: aminotransferase class I/II-fold pyridoxal phosphate-dependent enzyme [Candidatus Lokiarchaeota archaeon]|nr:aminotransferase class I/II-fold pyridoxal phosphate-dependent enzyme [Candidatus Lokiarchaeota archaeon]
MKELSKKIRNAPKSKIRELFDLAAGRSDVISLGIGQPDFSTPQPAIEGNINALNNKVTYYAPTKGVPELLQQLENKLKTVNNIETTWKDNIILTNGGSQALSLAFASIFNPGDEIVISSPNFISYFYLSAFFDLKIIEIERKNDFRPDIEKIKNSITEKTKAVLINSPNNPTGYSLDINELQEVVEIVKNNDLYLISDEVYENYLYDNSKHTSPASLKDMFERTITLNAMSKLYSATGFRLGYVAANKEIIDTMEKYHQYTVAGTNHAAQYGFLEALKMDTSFFNDILKSFDERRLLAYNRLIEMGFEVVKPKGAFYIMPKIINFKLTGAEFSKRVMKDQAVAIVPGNVFGSYSEYMLRMSYATKMDKLEEAMDRIEKFTKTI